MKILILPTLHSLYFLSEKEAIEQGYDYDLLVDVPDEEVVRWMKAENEQEKKEVQEQMKQYFDMFLKSQETSS